MAEEIRYVLRVSAIYQRPGFAQRRRQEQLQQQYQSSDLSDEG